MTAASLEFQLAERQIWHFEHREEATRQELPTSDSRQCEEWLRSGIDAYKWLARSEEAARLADAEGLAELTPAADAAIAGLYQRWLTQYDLAESWIANVLREGHSLASLREYQECGSLVRDWLEQHEFYLLGQQSLSEQFEE